MRSCAILFVKVLFLTSSDVGAELLVRRLQVSFEQIREEVLYQKTNKNEKFLSLSSDQRRQKVPMATRDQLALKRGLWTISTAFTI